MSSGALNTRVMLLSLVLYALPVGAGAACNVSATAVGFGSYDTLSPLNHDTTGTVTVTCSGLPSMLMGYEILLSKGGAASYTPRQLASGSNKLNYNLFTGITHTTIWGDGTGGSAKVSGSMLVQLVIPTSNNHTIFGRVPARQNVASGSYADSITVTVNY